jgi:hypothetical protein
VRVLPHLEIVGRGFELHQREGSVRRDAQSSQLHRLRNVACSAAHPDQVKTGKPCISSSSWEQRRKRRRSEGERDQIVRKVDRLQVLQRAQVRHVAGEVVRRDRSDPMSLTDSGSAPRSELFRRLSTASDGSLPSHAGEHVVVGDQRLEVAEPGHALRELAVEEVAAHVDDLQRHQPGHLPRERAPQAEPGEREHAEVRQPRQRREEGVDAERLGQRRRAGGGADDVELRHAVAVALHEGVAGLVVAAVAEVGVVAPGAQHRRVVEQLLDLEQRPCLGGMQMPGFGHHC